MVCLKRSHCRGPKLGGKRFALLSDRQSGLSVAAARQRWGDYDKVYLVITNFGSRLVEFHARQVNIGGRGGAWKKPVNLTILSSNGGGAWIYFGGDPTGVMPSTAVWEPVPTSPQARKVIGQDPISQADLKLESQELQKLSSQLKPALRVQLHSRLLQPQVILAGCLFFPRRRHGHWRQLRVELAGVKFVLPLK